MSRPVDDTLTPRHGANFPIVDGPIKFRTYPTTDALPSPSAYPPGTMVGVGSGNVLGLYFTDGSAWHAFGGASATPTVTALLVHPSGGSLVVLGNIQFSATAIMSDGTTLDVTDDVSWSTSDGSVMTIDAHGLASVLGGGSVNIVADYLDGFWHTVVSLFPSLPSVDASATTYEPGTASDWIDPPPASASEALDRVAAVLSALGHKA